MTYLKSCSIAVKSLLLFLVLNVSALNAAIIKDISYAYVEPQRIDSLDFSNQRLPDSLDFGSFVNLRYLDLSNCDLNELPPNVSRLNSLTHLVLDNNVFTDLNGLFEELTQLKELDFLSLENGLMFFIPEKIAALNGLKHLNLANNFISDLPKSLFSLNELRELNMSKNNLDTIPLGFVQLQALNQLDLSHNKEIETERLVNVLNGMQEMNQLLIQGLDTVAPVLSELKFIESMDLSNGNFYTLPRGLNKMRSLKSFKLLSSLMFWDELIETFADHKELQKLEIGGCGLQNIPYNLFKLKSLDTLVISQSNIRRVSSSIQRMHLKYIRVNTSYIHQTSSFTGQLLSMKNLRSVYFSNCAFLNGNIIANRGRQLQQVYFHQCDLKQVSQFQVKSNIKVHLIESAYTLDQVKNWKANNNQTHWKERAQGTVKRSSPLEINGSVELDRTFKLTVYGEVGLVKDLDRKVLLDIPGEAFVDSNKHIVGGEIELEVFYHSRTIPLVLRGIEYQLRVAQNEYQGVAPKSLIRLKATQDGQHLTLAEGKHIQVRLFEESDSLQLYKFIPGEHLMLMEQPLQADSMLCFKNYNLNLDEELIQYWKENHPRKENYVRQSKVFLELKKGRRKKPFYFYLRPEYGFTDNYLALFGNRVKAYPEFRPYKNLKWTYAGENEEEDFKQLYAISDGKPERMKRKSSFYLYVMSLNDVRIAPASQGDFYEMTFNRGFDTLVIPVIPQTGILKPRKIQKWHKRKFIRYLDLHKKRTIRWQSLDSIQSLKETEYQMNLNEFRQILLSRLAYNKERGQHQLNFKVTTDEEYLIGETEKRKLQFAPVKKIVDREGKVISTNHLYTINKQGDIIQTASTRLPLFNSNKSKVVCLLKNGQIAVAIIGTDFDGVLEMDIMDADKLLEYEL